MQELQETWIGIDPWIGKIPWRRAWQPTSAFLPGDSHGQRNLVGYSARHHTESDTTEHTARMIMTTYRTVITHFPCFVLKKVFFSFGCAPVRGGILVLHQDMLSVVS